MSITNIDVTLRDGGYRNNFNFDLEFAIKHARASVSAGFDWVEIAYRKGSYKNIPGIGLTGLGDDDYIRKVSAEVGRDHTALILHPKNTEPGDLIAMHRAGAGMVRICVASGDVSGAENYVRCGKDLHLVVSANITRVSELPGMVDGVFPGRLLRPTNLQDKGQRWSFVELDGCLLSLTRAENCRRTYQNTSVVSIIMSTLDFSDRLKIRGLGVFWAPFCLTGVDLEAG